jgi:hypothetical protein
MRSLRKALDLLDAAGPTKEPDDDDIPPALFDDPALDNPQGE